MRSKGSAAGCAAPFALDGFLRADGMLFPIAPFVFLAAHFSQQLEKWAKSR